jgi:endonuclease/exonuclease/phosphatase family metal-dependent hydrolase
MRVRVLTINIQNDEGDARRIGVINREICRLDPDLVALQEVPRRPSRADITAVLDGSGLSATHQGDVLAYVPPFEDRYGGSALATRWPHRVVDVLDMRGMDATDVPWCTLAARVTVPNLGDLLFVATTGSWRLDAEVVRERQVLAVADLDARHRTGLPSIIAGDFNAGPESASVRFMSGQRSLSGRSVYYHDVWVVAAARGGDPDPGYTWTVDNPAAAAEISAIVRQPGHRRRLDYVFIGSWHAHPHARAEVVSATRVLAQPIDGLWPSDLGVAWPGFRPIARLPLLRSSPPCKPLSKDLLRYVRRHSSSFTPTPRIPPASLPVVLVVAAPPEAGLVTTEWCAVEPLVHAPQDVQPALVRRIGVINDPTLKRERAHAGPFLPVRRPVRSNA